MTAREQLSKFIEYIDGKDYKDDAVARLTAICLSLAAEVENLHERLNGVTQANNQFKLRKRIEALEARLGA